MVVQIGGIKYTPGMYGKKRPTGYQLADKYFRDLDKKGKKTRDFSHDFFFSKNRCWSPGNCRYFGKKDRL